MSRDIKFRAWHTEYKKWLDIYTLICMGTGSIGRVNTRITNELFDAQEFVLQEYTGLKDKNGVEIYEGDIMVEHLGEATPVIRWQVVWLESRYILRAVNSDVPDRYLSHNPREIEPEVIGNIYENPELLK